MTNPTIVSFSNSEHRKGVIALWHAVFGYETAHNEPSLVIDRKLAVDDGLFFVAVCDDVVVGSIMAGFDGHRGWLYSLAVAPEYRNRDIGTDLVSKAERTLATLGCMKINLQIIEGNEDVQAFYASLGYSAEVRVSMGKRIPENITNEAESGRSGA